MNVWCRDPKTGKPSATLTVFLVGTAVVLLKYALSGLTIAGVPFEHMDGSDFAMAVGALGAVYFGRKWTDRSSDVTPPKPPIEGSSEA
jgi:hypothetical protein